MTQKNGSQSRKVELSEVCWRDEHEDCMLGGCDCWCHEAER